MSPQVLKKATIRKEQEPDFEEKRFNVTIGEDEREFDKENDFFRERSYRIIREYDLLPFKARACTLRWRAGLWFSLCGRLFCLFGTSFHPPGVFVLQ